MGNQTLSKVVLNPPGLCLGVVKMVVEPYPSTKKNDWVDMKWATTSRQLISNEHQLLFLSSLSTIISFVL